MHATRRVCQSHISPRAVGVAHVRQTATASFRQKLVSCAYGQTRSEAPASDRTTALPDGSAATVDLHLRRQYGSGGVKRAGAGPCAGDAAAALGWEEPSLTVWCLNCSMDVRPACSEGLALARPLPHTQQWRSGELKRGPRLHSAPVRTAPPEQNAAYSMQPLPLLLSHSAVSVHSPWCLPVEKRKPGDDAVMYTSR
eukprot:scaffold73052_cov103-Phaeocystis_antarctica.AAC.2